MGRCTLFLALLLLACCSVHSLASLEKQNKLVAPLAFIPGGKKRDFSWPREATALYEGVKEKLEGLMSSVALGSDPNPALDVQGEADHSKYLADLEDAKSYAFEVMRPEGWSQVAERGGVKAHKKYLPQSAYGSKYPCVKAEGVIQGSPAEVKEMMLDSERVLEYNKYSKGRDDVYHLDSDIKIVWNKTKPPLSKKLHDFCTIMRVIPGGDGGYILLTRATSHPEAPSLPNHVRSEIMLGVTALKPVPGDTNKTYITTVNHVVSNGVPAMVADRVSTKNAIDFIHNVGNAVSGAVAATVEEMEEVADWE
ncbi:unnamed protein product [Chrysoparadoxa australica]